MDGSRDHDQKVIINSFDDYGEKRVVNEMDFFADKNCSKEASTTFEFKKESKFDGVEQELHLNLSVWQLLILICTMKTFSPLENQRFYFLFLFVDVFHDFIDWFESSDDKRSDQWQVYCGLYWIAQNFHWSKF